MEQYFTAEPTTEEKIENFKWTILDREYTFFTSNSVFSKHAIDFGTMAMLEAFREDNDEFEGKFLDLGCGLGPVGVAIGSLYPEANITMLDINIRAVKLAEMNIGQNKVNNIEKILASNCFENLGDLEKFKVIMTNPPIRAGKKTVFKFYDDSYAHLDCGGNLYAVVQKKQGASSSKKKLEELFGNCQILTKKKGYWVLKAVK